MNESTVIQTHNLTKVYGKPPHTLSAVNDVTLTINKGESIAIVGKSGSGKSTLMHLLALLDSPTTGTIEINGINTQNLQQGEINQLRNKFFGFVFQQFFLNANASVLDNVMLPLKIAKLPRNERIERATEALRAVELAEKAKAKANDLSGGQKQRVVIARAIVNQPSLLFADEPTGNLDSVTSTAIEDTLFTLNKEQGLTLVIVTHDKDLADRCQRQITIVDGRIEQKGSN